MPVIIPDMLNSVGLAFTLSGRTYTLVFNYNATFDFFTVDLLLGDTVLVEGEKMVLNEFLFREAGEDSEGNINPNFPEEVLFMASTDDSIQRVSYDNLGDSVLLWYAERSEIA